MKNMSSVISDRAIGEAAAAYLERSEGMSIIGRGHGPVDFVCREPDGGIAFVGISAGDGISDSVESIDRAEVEAEMIRYAVQEDLPGGVKMRFDQLHIFVTSGQKGLLRYHRAAVE